MYKPPAVYADGGAVAMRIADVDYEVYVRQGPVFRRVFWGDRGRLSVVDMVMVTRLVATPAVERQGRRP